MTSFGDFLDEEKQKVDKDAQYVAETKTEWLTAIDSIYEQVGQWLEEYRDKGIAIEFARQSLVEQEIGHYDVRRMVIKFGSKQVSIKPEGCLFFGCKGSFSVESNNSRNAPFNIELTVLHQGFNRGTEREFEWVIKSGEGNQRKYEKFEREAFLAHLQAIMK
ncbi:hypothetical protein M2F94_03695 [Vibrio vulnificus]|nr:hypothetical protein [Vibrio vulnificus]